jgi:hypothetical protein
MADERAAEKRHRPGKHAIPCLPGRVTTSQLLPSRVALTGTGPGAASGGLRHGVSGTLMVPAMIFALYASILASYGLISGFDLE